MKSDYNRDGTESDKDGQVIQGIKNIFQETYLGQNRSYAVQFQENRRRYLIIYTIPYLAVRAVRTLYLNN